MRGTPGADVQKPRGDTEGNCTPGCTLQVLNFHPPQSGTQLPNWGRGEGGKWRESVSSDTALLSGQTSFVPELFCETNSDHGAAKPVGKV